MLISAALLLVGFTSVVLFLYGLNMLYLSWRSLRIRPVQPRLVGRGEEVDVAVQLPIYNERYVAERIIDATARLDWPRERLEIQVLDDSDDETVAIVAARVALWRRCGLRIEHVRRANRVGYKAGALAHGLERTDAGLLAIFDADFVPGRDFLRRVVGPFADPSVGFVQARWGHLNERYSWITRLQALSIDFHFLVEQAVRSASGYLTNFTGTAGIWRREAIASAGGWNARTLTEDLDLSYRAQLAGWKAVYCECVEVPEELPVSVDAYRRQQARWATGSFQCAFLLTLPLLRSRLPVAAKWQGLVHLYSYAVPLLMLAQIVCYPLLLAGMDSNHHVPAVLRLPLAINVISLAPAIAFTVAQMRRGRRWWHGLPGLVCQVIGAGLSVTVWLSFIRALRPGGEFLRTPKYRIERSGQEWRDAAYASSGDPIALIEVAVGMAAFGVAAVALAYSELLMAAYAAVIGAGFAYLGGSSLIQALEVMTVRRPGKQGLLRLRQAGPALLLLAAPAALLFVLAQWPDPFEDSFQHWLLAANLLQTGRLADPLFGMQDTWLPAYSFFAAAVLRVAGWHQIGALKLANVGLALITLAIVRKLAPTPRQGALAVLLLALNPIFLLTATSAVAEPLILLALTASAASLLARRPALAASWAVIACLTGTKAWLWLFCAVVVLFGGALLSRRRPKLAQRLAWAMPAVAVLLVLQLTAGQASHSAVRAAQEVGSAVARGDLNPDPAGRALGFVGYFLLASLPLVVLAPLGVRAYLAKGAAARLRLVILPGLLYLGAVTALVFVGIYSGSHRYYYLALPGLALLAAAGLDRHPARLGVAFAAAAGLVTVAFLPVLASFSAIDRGLVAGGRASAGQPGGLLTDSPVAAYYSGKQPDRIFGSRALPADSIAATGWLHDRMVGSVVTEDISYYRLTAVFPDLVRGLPVAPFSPLGSAAAYTVPGGKRTFAYSLPPERLCAWVTDSALAEISPADQPNAGKTAGLAKGLVLEAAGGPVAGEGMGFGAPLVRYSDGDYFSGSATVVDMSTPATPVWVKTFELDRLGVDSDRSFRAVPSRGQVVVIYSLSGGTVDIRVDASNLKPGFQQVVLLNEQSSRFDDFADGTQTRLRSEIGSWRPVQGEWGRFRSAALGLEWSAPRLPAAEGMYAARETRSPDIDFSGIEYVFGPGFKGTEYQLVIGKAR
ncbi:MAG: glycosyltransferase [Candidatus Dormibacteraeota bacterium]|nr:glycosyltransferase [Candidatus Dormibacteraeota bacterium]